jgi:endonuclease-3
MAQVSRTGLFAKLHKLLKKHYKPVGIDAQRSVLEHVLFACLLEDAPYEVAETAMAALSHTFFDWNEVRVTSVSELAEVLAVLPDPRAAAMRVKRVLHAVFEASYSFDLEDSRKKNLGVAQKWFAKLDGVSPFCVAAVTQAALGGHAIPLDRGTMHVMHILDLATEKEVAAFTVPGLERAIPKSKGVEFGSLLHQLGAEYTANPFAPKIREMLTEVNPDAANRFPKRRVARPAPEPVKPAPAASAEKSAKKKGREAAPAAKATPAAEKAPAKPAAKADKSKKKPEKPVEKAPARPSPSKPTPAKPTAAKPAAAKPAPSKAADAGKKSSTTLTKKKPR